MGCICYMCITVSLNTLATIAAASIMRCIHSLLLCSCIFYMFQIAFDFFLLLRIAAKQSAIRMRWANATRAKMNTYARVHVHVHVHTDKQFNIISYGWSRTNLYIICIVRHSSHFKLITFTSNLLMKMLHILRRF